MMQVLRTREVLILYIQFKSHDPGSFPIYSRVAQWKRAGPITQRSVDRNYALLVSLFFSFFTQIPINHFVFPMKMHFKDAK